MLQVADLDCLWLSQERPLSWSSGLWANKSYYIQSVFYSVKIIIVSLFWYLLNCCANLAYCIVLVCSFAFLCMCITYNYVFFRLRREVLDKVVAIVFCYLYVSFHQHRILLHWVSFCVKFDIFNKTNFDQPVGAICIGPVFAQRIAGSLV